MQPEGKVENSKPLVCEFCKSDSVIFDNVSFEYVCSSCGCVSSQDPNSDSLASFRNNSGYNDRTRTGMPESLAIHNKGLSTLIGIGDTDARGKALDSSQKNNIQRLRTWNNRAQLNDSVSRNLEKALKLLNNFGDKLYLSQAVIEGAAYIYRKAAIKKLAKGRSTLGLVGAALYAACRETATPKTITDIATACNITTKDIMSHYKLILKELSLQMPVLQGPDYVTLICNRLQLSEKTKREALRIFSLGTAKQNFNRQKSKGVGWIYNLSRLPELQRIFKASGNMPSCGNFNCFIKKTM